MSTDNVNTGKRQAIVTDGFEDTDQGVDLATIFNILRGKWYVFVVCVVAALMGGIVYIYRTPKSYLQEATVLVKDSKSGTASGVEAFADIAGVAGLVNSSVENEQLILQSRMVMEAVVRHLGLQYFYYQPRFMRQDELYDVSPFEIIPENPDLSITSTAFTVKFEGDDSFSYISEDTTFVAPFDQLIEIPNIGKATLRLKPATRDWYLSECGDEVRVMAIELQNAVSYFQSGLSVELVRKDASLISLSFVSTSPRKAADILNTLIEEYSRTTIDSKNEVLKSSQEFIASRLQVISAELAEVDGRIETFKRSERTANPIDEAKAYFAKADNLDEKIADYEVQLRLIRELREFMDQHNNDYAILPFNISNNSALNSQINSYNDLVTRYRRLIAASSENSPIVRDADASLQTMLTTIRQTTADLERSIELNLHESRQMGNVTTARMVSANSNMRALTSIERDQRIKSELYTYLLQKSEENAIMYSMTESNIRPIDSAFGNPRPVAPRKTRILGILFLLGLVGPLAFYYIKDMLYTKVRGRSDVTDIVTAPVVGEIPSKPKEKQHQDIFVEPGATNQISESFRILRTNLKFISVDKTAQVFAMTSTQPGEGKSYVTANLAMTFALAGKKVCLVDLDLRKMATTRLFKLRKEKGLSEFLSGSDSDIMPFVHTTQYENVSILPGGTIPPNPAELLMSERFDKAIDALREHFDYVLLDNPPFDVVADTGIANRVADVTLYVIRIGKLDRHALPAIEDIYQERKLRNMAIVLTDVNYELLAYSMGYSGYGKSYGYGYGKSYGYGYYGEDAETGKKSKN